MIDFLITLTQKCPPWFEICTVTGARITARYEWISLVSLLAVL